MTARRISFCDVTNRPGTTWLAQLTADQAEAVANTALSGDVLVKGFDWHARFESLGSRSEYRR